jgi:AraC family transcriptional regulator of adaptative response / DNA-3-methyladenine glycosylase II
MNYQPPFNWQHWHDFSEFRLMDGIETLGSSSYGRTFNWLTETGSYIKGWFNAVHRPDKQGFNVSINIDDAKYLYPVSQKIRQVFDLNANVELINSQIINAGFPAHNLQQGIRIPGSWSPFEAGIRAILGQQVSVKAATNLLNTLILHLGNKETSSNGNMKTRYWFPTPKQIAKSDLAFLKIPQARKTTLITLATWCNKHPEGEVKDWLELKGIGPWTVEYAQMRGEANTDIWLDSDLGIKKALDIFPEIDAEKAKPWRSYLTFNMWSML